MKLYHSHIEPVAETFAFCLMRNHFHLLVRIKDEHSHKKPVDGENISQKFGNFLNAYAKAINKAYGRMGSLFQHPFGRIPVNSDAYFTCLVAYIHLNPQKHGFVPDFRKWPYSSYYDFLKAKPTRLMKNEVLEWFGGTAGFEEFHRNTEIDGSIKNLIEEDG